MRPLVVLALLVLPSLAAAQTRLPPMHGVRVEGGMSDTHDGDDRYPAVAVRAFWTLDSSGPVTLEIGGAYFTYYGAADAGLDVRVPILPRVAGVIRGGAGVLLEGEYLGIFWRFGGGIGVQLTRRHGLLMTWQRGGHNNRNQGPHMVMLGYEYRR